MNKNKKIIVTASIILGICGGVVGFVMLSGFPWKVTDCGWDDTALAWIDENENGVWESQEKPLANVQFIADDIQHDYDTSNKAISDVNGKASVTIFPVDCTDFEGIKVVIKAIPPDGYESTTPSEISVPADAIENHEDDNFLFGFIQKGP